MAKSKKPSMPRLLDFVSEKEFTALIIGMAKAHGWKAAHFRAALSPSGRWLTPVQGDGKGFPDLVLCKPPHLFFIELKRNDGKETQEQKDWLANLRQCGTVQASTWRPKDIMMIERMLKNASP